jgi:hypothetical protein
MGNLALELAQNFIPNTFDWKSTDWLVIANCYLQEQKS